MSAKRLSLMLLASFSLVSSLALADTSTGPAPIASPNQPPTLNERDDVDLTCRFEGGGTGKDKDSTWYKSCRAEIRIDASRHDDSRWIFGDRDDFFRVRCDDGDFDDDHGHDHDRNDSVIYGSSSWGGDELGRRDLLITGDRTSSPLIRVLGLDLNDLADDHNHHDDRHDRAKASIHLERRGISFLLFGVCEIRHHHEEHPVP